MVLETPSNRTDSPDFHERFDSDADVCSNNPQDSLLNWTARAHLLSEFVKFRGIPRKFLQSIFESVDSTEIGRRCSIPPVFTGGKTRCFGKSQRTWKTRVFHLVRGERGDSSSYNSGRCGPGKNLRFLWKRSLSMDVIKSWSLHFKMEKRVSKRNP